MSRLRLRTVIGSVQCSRSNITTEVAAYYGASLSRTTILETRNEQQSFTKFAIDEATAAMVTASRNPNFVDHYRHSHQMALTPYRTNQHFRITATDSAVTALLITPGPTSYVVFATPANVSEPGRIHLVPFGEARETTINTRSQEREINYDNMGVSYAIHDNDIWHMAASPSGGQVAAACSEGVVILRQPERSWGNRIEKLLGDSEFMAVSFKDENVLLAGMRSGTVWLVDLRTYDATSRLKHGSGVTATRTLLNDNYIVVRGLETMSIYDLRFSPLSESLSKPYMTFPGSYASDRFGLGFDYDPVLGVIATGML
jgi:WD40 repeat protein